MVGTIIPFLDPNINPKYTSIDNKKYNNLNFASGVPTGYFAKQQINEPLVPNLIQVVGMSLQSNYSKFIHF